MKKFILSIALTCFIGAANVYAQSSDARATNPATAVVPGQSSVSKTTTVSGGQSVQTPAETKTAAKAETKKAGCNHSSKSCCMSKEGASMKDCSHKQTEKAEIKSEKPDIKNNQ